MDFNANHHGWETPDALPSHAERFRETERSDLLRDTLSRVEDMARDATKTEERHAHFSGKDTTESLIISG